MHACFVSWEGAKVYELWDHQDMLEKARRELGRYKNNPTADTLFNLFVTIKHVEDYALYRLNKRKERKAFSKKTRDHFGDLYRFMNFVANKKKHCMVESDADMETNHISYKYDSTFGGAPVGALPINGNSEYYISCDGFEYEMGALAELLIEKWESLIR